MPEKLTAVFQSESTVLADNDWNREAYPRRTKRARSRTSCNYLFAIASEYRNRPQIDKLEEDSLYDHDPDKAEKPSSRSV